MNVRTILFIGTLASFFVSCKNDSASERAVYQGVQKFGQTGSADQIINNSDVNPVDITTPFESPSDVVPTDDPTDALLPETTGGSDEELIGGTIEEQTEEQDVDPTEEPAVEPTEDPVDDPTEEPTSTTTSEPEESRNPFHNYDLPHDVNGSGQITPLDSLNVINFIRDFPNADLSTQEFTGRFVDVNNDGVVSSADALAVIDQLRRMSSSDCLDDSVSKSIADRNADGNTTLLEGMRGILELVGKLGTKATDDDWDDRFDRDCNGAVNSDDLGKFVGEVREQVRNRDKKLLTLIMTFDTNFNQFLEDREIDSIRSVFSNLVGRVSTAAGFDATLDFNDDGVINIQDFTGITDLVRLFAELRE